MRKIMILVVVLASVLVIGCGQQAAPAPQQQAPAAQAAPAQPAFSVQNFVREYVAALAQSNNIVSMDSFVADLKAGTDMFVVDIRSADDYAKGHIRGAVNVPWNTNSMFEAIPHLPTDRTVFVHCYSGQTAGQAIVTMRMAGIQAVSVNSGWNLGISRVEGYEELVTTDPTPINTSFNNGVSQEVQNLIRAYYEELFTHRGTPFANRFISEENAKAVLDAADPGVQFVDLRRPEDFAAGRIATAVNVPFGPNMVDLISNLPADKRFIVNCYSGQTANQAIALFNLMGYDSVNLFYGMGTPRTAPRGWVNQGFPLVN
jgi:rhodanese-related sulfurtransferase